MFASDPKAFRCRETLRASINARQWYARRMMKSITGRADKSLLNQRREQDYQSICQRFIRYSTTRIIWRNTGSLKPRHFNTLLARRRLPMSSQVAGECRCKRAHVLVTSAQCAPHLYTGSGLVSCNTALAHEANDANHERKSSARRFFGCETRKEQQPPPVFRMRFCRHAMSQMTSRRTHGALLRACRPGDPPA